MTGNRAAAPGSAAPSTRTPRPSAGTAIPWTWRITASDPFSRQLAKTGREGIFTLSNTGQHKRHPAAKPPPPHPQRTQPKLAEDAQGIKPSTTGHTDTDPGLYHRHNRTSFVQPTPLVRPRVATLPFGGRH